MRQLVTRGPWEVEAVLTLIVLDDIAVIATYSRFPPALLLGAEHPHARGELGLAAVLVGAAAIWWLWFRQPSRMTLEEASPAISSSA